MNLLTARPIFSGPADEAGQSVVAASDVVQPPSPTPPGVVLFHAYEWDSYTERQAAALAKRAQGLSFYVLADETRGKLPFRGFPKIAHTEALFASQGLPMQDGLWCNADYALYHAAASLPEYEFYLRFDADVRVTIDLADVVGHMRRTGCDWLTMPLRGTESWQFRQSLDGLPCARAAYVPLMATMLSRRAIMILERERRALAAQYVEGRPWAFCEGFVPSILRESGVRIGGIEKVAETRLFRAEMGLLETDERLGRNGCMFHAVLDVPRLRAKLDRVVRHLVGLREKEELERLGRIAAAHGFAADLVASLDRLGHAPPPGSRPPTRLSAPPAVPRGTAPPSRPRGLLARLLGWFGARRTGDRRLRPQPAAMSQAGSK